MINPFDRTFFRFMFGFVFILSLSFAVLYFVGKYSSDLEERQLTASKNNSVEIKIQR